MPEHNLKLRQHKLVVIDEFATSQGRMAADNLIEIGVELARMYRESKGIEIPLSEIPRPRVIDKVNWGMAYFLNVDETFREWIDTAAMATTVDTLYDPENARLESGRRLGPVMTDFLKNALDTVAIRARSSVVAERMSHGVKIDEKWLSLACGNALPVLNAARSAGAKPEITLVDFNFNNLRHAKRLAKSRGQENLIKDRMFRDLVYKKGFRKPQILRQLLAPLAVKQRPYWNFKPLKKGHYDRIDAVGFVEYLPPEAAARFIKRVYELLAPGGIFIFDGLSENHAQREFYEGVLQWPLTKFTSIDDMLNIIYMSNVSIEGNTVDVFESQDGIYPIYEIRKPL